MASRVIRTRLFGPDPDGARIPFRYMVAAAGALLLMVVACGSDTEEQAPPTTASLSTSGPPTTLSTVDTTLPSPVEDETGDPAPVTSSEDTAPPSAVVERYEPEFTPGSCPFQPPSGTDPVCGYLSVPENRENPAGRQVRLAVAIFPARSTEAYPPIVYLEGGPGGEALEAIPFTYEDRFSFLDAERTLVMFDQRGVGYSDPALSCHELVDLAYELLDEDLSAEEVVAREVAVLDRCRERWVDDGTDLAHYNSSASAADVADLRVALGYDEWDLYGVSYGTRLALTVMRDHPEGVRSVILDSTYPPEIDGVALIVPNAARAFDELFGACASDPMCNSTYGDLESLLFSLVEQLNASPAELWVLDFLNFGGYPALLDGDSMLGLVFQSLYSEVLLPGIPKLIADAREGHFFNAQTLMSYFLTNEAFFSAGQFLSVMCHEEVPFSDPASVRSGRDENPRLAPLVDGALVQSEYAFDFCSGWGAGVADSIEAEPVSSDIPTLVMAGRFDPITPPDYGRRVADRLDNRWFVEFPTLGHGVAAVEGCPRSVTLAFLADPHAAPDRSCVAGMPAIDFDVFAPSDEVALVEDRILQYTVLVPEGWSGQNGYYQRGLGSDATALLIVPGAAGLGDLVLTGVARAWTGVGIEESEEVEFGDRVWRRFSAAAGSVSLEAALYEGRSSSIVVALVSDPRETPHLVDQVLLPALESFGPVAG